MEGKDQYVRSAIELEQRGDKKAKGSFFKNLFSSKGERLDDARDLYEKAANNYKLADEWKKAGEMYKKWAECEKQSDGMPATHILDAVNCYKKVSNHEFLEMAEGAIKMLAEDGRLNQAARLKKEVAEVFESEYDLDEAAKSYLKAAELYLMEDGVSFANQCYVKAADILVMLKEVNYEEVINIYEKVVSEYLKKDLLKASAKNLVQKVWLWYMANDDLIGAKARYSSFSVEDPSFSNSREGDLLSGLFNAKEANDLEQFEKTLHNYARITPFDKINLQLLVHVKDTLSSMGGLNLDGNDIDTEDKMPDLT